MRDAVDVIEELWHATVRRAGALPEEAFYRSVNDEWSLAQTLRHTIFVVDAWYGHAAALRSDPFHPIGVPASFTTNGAEFGIDESAAPTLDEILAVRAERIADLRAYLAEVTQEELDRVRGPNSAIGCPPPAERTAVQCLQVIFSDEWAHMQFANRDLAILEKWNPRSWMRRRRASAVCSKAAAICGTDSVARSSGSALSHQVLVRDCAAGSSGSRSSGRAATSAMESSSIDPVCRTCRKL
jgi:hypothetical protein